MSRAVALLVTLLSVVGILSSPAATPVGAQSADSGQASGVGQTGEQYRALDTRDGAKPADGSTVCTTVTGRGGVADDVVSVAVNMVAAQSDGPGFVAAFAAGSSVPPTSVLNYGATAPVSSSSAIVAVGDAGQICFRLTTATHLIVDVAGAFDGDTHRPVQPFRARDTREGTRPAARSVTCTRVAGINGVPADAAAVSVNITAIQPDAAGFLTVFPEGTPTPGTTNLSVAPGDILGNGAVVAVGTSGEICVYSHVAAHHIVDVDGWIAADSAVRVPASAHRLLDTRTTARPVADSTTCLQVTGNGVPDDVASVLVSVTAVTPDAPGFVTAHASGQTRPDVSSLNYDVGLVRTTGGMVPVGADGQICLYTLAATHLIVDLLGFQSPAAPAATPGSRSFTQFRALDSRSGPKPAAQSVRCFGVVGQGGIEADVVAIAVNLAVVEQTGPGFARMFPAGAAVPETTVVNYSVEQGPASSNSVVEVGSGGEVCVFLQSAAHVVADVSAAFYDDTYTPAPVPFRARDTRTGATPAAGSVRCTQVAGVGGVPADAAAVSINLAATDSIHRGYLAVFPAGMPQPLTSNVNFDGAETVNNGAVVAVGDGGQICVFSLVAIDHVLDVNGWFDAGSDVQALPVPRRLFDSRVTSKPVAGSSICLPVVGAGVPVGSTAVAVNVTAVNPEAAGFVTTHPAGQPRPMVSSLNYDEGTVRASGGMVPVGADGEVCVYTLSTTDLVVDLLAYQTESDVDQAPGAVLLRQPSGRIGFCEAGYDEPVSEEDVLWWDWMTRIDPRGTVDAADGSVRLALYEIEAFHRVSVHERCSEGTYVFEWVGDAFSHFERCAATTTPVRATPSRLSDVQWASDVWTTAGEGTNPCPPPSEGLRLFPGDPVDPDDPGANTPIDPAADAIRRLAGSGRQQTSAVIAGHSFPDGADVVYVAEESDGLAMALAAGSTQSGPVLLTGGSSDPVAEVLDAIAKLGDVEVVALGTAAANDTPTDTSADTASDTGISQEIIDEMARGRPTDRIEGDDIFETAANIASASWFDGATTVYLAEPVNLADGLAGGTLADGPIVLVPEDGQLPAAVARAIETVDPDRIVALGGVDAISEDMLDQAAGHRPAARVEGPSRFETAAAVSQVVFPDGAPTVYLARADIAPDAVVAGTVSDGPILLVESCNGVHPATHAEIERLGATDVIGLGGTDAICDETLLAALSLAPDGER